VKTRLNRSILIALLSFALFGCPGAQPKYLAKPAVVSADGTYIHVASGMTFPIAVGDFQRVQVLRYDEESLNVSAGYNWRAPAGLVAATIYVHPAPPLVSIGSPPEVVAAARAKLMNDEFELQKRQILRVHSGGRLIQESVVSLSQGTTTYAGKMATFEFEENFAGRRQPVQSHIFLFSYVDGKWTVKYRFSHPLSLDAAKEIDTFMKNLRWTFGGS